MASDVKTFDMAESDFIPISRREILSAYKLPVDIYLKISEKKLILIGRKGSQSVDKLRAIEKDSQARLYVRREDFKDCVGNNLMVAGIIIEKEGVSDPAKIEFLSRTVESVFREIEAVGFNLEALEHAKDISKSIQSLVSQKSDLLSVVSMMAGISDDLLRHCIAVSAISIMIGHGKGWTLQQTLEKVALGALLHDVGLKEIPRELLETPRHELSYEQRQIYETHVFRGVEILRSMPSVPEEVIQVALEHHENSFGQGYPRRLRDFKISPFAKVVALADCFAELTIKNINCAKPMPVDEAIDYIENVMGQPFSQGALVALKQALDKRQVFAVKIRNSG